MVKSSSAVKAVRAGWRLYREVREASAKNSGRVVDSAHQHVVAQHTRLIAN
jgi:hypothetical protein